MRIKYDLPGQGIKILFIIFLCAFVFLSVAQHAGAVVPMYSCQGPGTVFDSDTKFYPDYYDSPPAPNVNQFYCSTTGDTPYNGSGVRYRCAEGSDPYDPNNLKCTLCTSWNISGCVVTNDLDYYLCTYLGADPYKGSSYYQAILYDNCTYYGPDSVAPSAITNLAISSCTSSTCTLTWTAPGDDNTTGTATTYDMRYYTSAINSANWNLATPATGEPSPSAAGSSQSMTVAGLSGSTTYYFAIKTADEVPNWSGVSNVPYRTTSSPPDNTAPTVPDGLAAVVGGSTQINLSWTASTDPIVSGESTSGVGGYRIERCQDVGCTVFSFVANVTSGTTYANTGLTPGTSYTYRVRAYDNASPVNNSGWSGTASATTATAPVVSLTSSDSDIISGDPVTLTWSSTNTTSCDGSPWTSSTAVSGSQSVTPVASTVYSITCAGPGGTATQSVMITVSAPPLPTATLSALPSSILSGQSSTLTWSSTDATSCSATWTSSTAAAGSQPVTPPASTVYSITCTGPGGSATQSTSVTVTVPAAPTISLTVSPSSSINLGDAITLSWVTTGTVSCTASGGWSGAKSVPNGSETLTPSATADYILTCVNTVNTSVSQQITVTVTDLPPDISNGAPSGTRPASTATDGLQWITISVRTNEPAYCSYNLNTDTTFANMVAANGTMQRDAARTYHSATVSVANGVSYLYYIRCQDDPAGNENTIGYPISFSVANPPNFLPIANMTVGPLSGVVPLAVTADGSASYDTDGTIVQYTWQWGDGTPDTAGAAAITAFHTYTTPGTYTLRLTVTDNQSGAGTAQQTITVTAASQPPEVSTTGICTPMCTQDSDCLASGDICAPTGICVANGSGIGPGRSQGSFSLDGSTWQAAVVGIDTPPNFPANTASVMMSVQTDANAECQYSTTADVAYGNTTFMKQFYSTCVANTICATSLAVPKESVAAQSEQAYHYYVRCKDSQTNIVNDIDYHLSFTVGGPTLISGPSPYVCWINQNFIRSGIPYLFDICRPECSANSDCTDPGLSICDPVKKVCVAP